MTGFKEVFLLFFIFHTFIMAASSGTVKLFEIEFALRIYVWWYWMRKQTRFSKGSRVSLMNDPFDSEASRQLLLTH